MRAVECYVRVIAHTRLRKEALLVHFGVDERITLQLEGLAQGELDERSQHTLHMQTCGIGCRAEMLLQIHEDVRHGEHQSLHRMLEFLCCCLAEIVGPSQSSLLEVQHNEHQHVQYATVEQIRHQVELLR